MFKSIKKKRPIRKASSSESEEEEVNQEALEETIELQKLRKRAHGVNAATLASGKKVTKVDELVHNDPDPFKLKTGGMLTLDQAKKAAKEQEKAEAGEEEEIIGTQFSKETRVRFVNFLYFIHFFRNYNQEKVIVAFFLPIFRDEDEEMRKFIETEMDKRTRGRAKDEESDEVFFYINKY